MLSIFDKVKLDSLRAAVEPGSDGLGIELVDAGGVDVGYVEPVARFILMSEAKTKLFAKSITTKKIIENTKTFFILTSNLSKYKKSHNYYRNIL